MEKNARNSRRAAGSRRIPRQAADLHVARKCAILLGIAGLVVSQPPPGLGASTDSPTSTTGAINPASASPYTVKTRPLGDFTFASVDLVITETTPADWVAHWVDGPTTHDSYWLRIPVEGLSVSDSAALFTALIEPPVDWYFPGGSYGHWLPVALAQAEGTVWMEMREHMTGDNFPLPDDYWRYYTGHYKLSLLYPSPALVTDENTGYSLKLDWHGISPQEGVRGWEIWRRQIAPPGAPAPAGRALPPDAKSLGPPKSSNR